MHGCNYFGKSTIRSAPFAIFGRQDILTLALEMDDMWKSGLKEKYREKLLKCGKISETFKMPESLIPEIYGTIERDKDGTLSTTKAQRTGCSMCGFGIHMEKRPHRFDMLYQSKLYIHASDYGRAERISFYSSVETKTERNFERGIQKWRMVRK